MEIEFNNKKLRELCENRKKAEIELGSESAKKLRTRLSDIDAAFNVQELTAGRPHPLERDRLGEFAVDLSGGKRLVFKPNHVPVPLNKHGKIDWAEITAITIIYIGDYHD